MPRLVASVFIKSFQNNHVVATQGFNPTPVLPQFKIAELQIHPNENDCILISLTKAIAGEANKSYAGIEKRKRARSK